ncbi:flagellar basal-body MS-ring/collar protein FliF [Polycladidibacter hongkongensis]|uniref:flagellar basal-body MS-ring/collar protein FliF n=1 Tax=Polycladidibacter hongkongensis TaxID=1647556 RepID=UPI00082F0558|nr:flagellar basal-body MS-ring/collar protein FliF [Pseudovibrio hongkongensis]
MAARDNAEKIYANLAELGTRRLAALAFIAVFTFAAIGAAAYLLSRPEQEVLYANLERDDVTQIGAALQTAGIPFDVSADGAVVSVNVGSTAKARMLLAEKGLPRGSGAGYELFDQMGSLGLTSFMQSITKVRALEGEIARSIQQLQGVKAARVHLVLPEKASFRAEKMKPTASVLLRADSTTETNMAQSVRYMVAAAVPGLTAESVTVLDTEGRLLATGEDPKSASTGRKAMLEEGISTRVQDSIRRALTPYLGVSNFEVSVAASVNTDNQRISETSYDPESRVERSFKVVRENESSQNASLETPTTVEQNLPEEEVDAQSGERSSAQNERREELTNYEISSRTVETIFDDYRVEKLSIAVLVNRERLVEELSSSGQTSLAKGDATAEGEQAVAREIPVDLTDKIAEVEGIIAAAAGIDAKRGDEITVTAVNFLTPSNQLVEIPEPTLTEMLNRNLGTLVNAAAILVVTLMIIWFGLRPAVNFLIPRPDPVVEQAANESGAGMSQEQLAAIAAGTAAVGELPSPDAVDGDAQFAVDGIDDTLMNRSALKKLERAVEIDDMQAAIILKQWMYNQDRA